MKVDFDLQPKDFLKLAFFVGTAASMMYGKGDDSKVQIAVLQSEMKALRTDVTEIKTMLIRRNR